MKPITFGSITLCWFNDMMTSSRSLTISCNCGLMWNVSGLFRHPPADTPRFQLPWYSLMSHLFPLSVNEGSSRDVSESRCTHSRWEKFEMKSTNDIQNSPASSWLQRRSRSCADTRSHWFENDDQSPLNPVVWPNDDSARGSRNLTNCTVSPTNVSALSREQSL